MDILKAGFLKTDNLKLKLATRRVRIFFFFTQMKSETVQYKLEIMAPRGQYNNNVIYPEDFASG